MMHSNNSVLFPLVFKQNTNISIDLFSFSMIWLDLLAFAKVLGNKAGTPDWAWAIGGPGGTIFQWLIC